MEPGFDSAVYNRFFNISWDLQIVADKGGVILECNPAWELLLGFQKTEVLGKKLVDFIVTEDQRLYVSKMAFLWNGSLQDLEVRMKHQDGSEVWFLWKGQIDISTKTFFGAGRDINSLKSEYHEIQRLYQTVSEMQQAQEKTHARLNRVLKNSSGVVYQMVRHHDGKAEFPFFSSNCFEVFEIDAIQASQNPNAIKSLIHPEDRNSMRTASLVSQNELGPFRWEGRIICKSHKVKWIQCHSVPERTIDGSTIWDGIIIDKTHLIESKQKLQLWKENFPAVTYQWIQNSQTHNGVFSYVSTKASDYLKISGVQTDELRKLIHPDDQSLLIQAFDGIKVEGQSFHQEGRFLYPNGEVRWWQTMASVVSRNVDEVIFSGIFIDVTAKILQQREIEQQRAQVVAASRMAALGEMSGAIAHEINNPLAIIMGKASAQAKKIGEGKIDEAQIHKDLNLIVLTTERIAKIIKSLRIVSRAGDSDPFVPTEVQYIIEDTLELCKSRFVSNNVELRVSHYPISLKVDCRQVQISQVLLNLLNNSFDAIDQLKERWIEIKISDEESVVKISVTDSGMGIAPQTVAKMMEPFFTTKEIGKGTGLGLSISTGIISAHQGKFYYDPIRPNTTFSIELPKRQSRSLSPQLDQLFDGRLGTNSSQTIASESGRLSTKNRSSIL